MTATLDRKYACRRCWATIQATQKSARLAGAAGMVFGAMLLVPIFLRAHKLGGRVFALPGLIAFFTARLFPRFEVVDPALEMGERSRKQDTTGAGEPAVAADSASRRR